MLSLRDFITMIGNQSFCVTLMETTKHNGAAKMNGKEGTKIIKMTNKMTHSLTQTQPLFYGSPH